MSFWHDLSDQMELFRLLSDEIKKIPNANPKLRALGEALNRNRLLMRSATLEMEDMGRDTVIAAAKQLQTALSDYAAYVKANRRTIPEQEALISTRAMRNAKDYLEKTSKQLADSLKTIESDTAASPELDMDTIKEQGRLAVMKPSTDNVSKQMIFAQILWLGENEALADRTGQRDHFAATGMGRRLDVLIQGIQRTEPTVQAEYAVMLARREQHLRRKVFEALQEARKHYAGRPDQEQKAMEELVNEPYYREAVSFYALRERLTLGPMGGLISAASTRYADDFNLEAMVNGGMHAALQAAPGGAEAERRAADKDLSALRTSGVPLNQFALNLYSVSRDIAADKDKKPSTFYHAIQQQLLNLLRENHIAPNTALYTKRLRALQIVAREYTRTHRTNPHTEKGRNRVKIANRILTLVNARLAEVQAAAPSPTQGRVDSAQWRMERNRALPGDYRVLARHQANIGTARVNPPAPARKRGVDDLDAAYSPTQRNILHGLYTAFNTVVQFTSGLPSNLVGFGMWFKRKFFPARQETAPQRYDSEHIPGLPGQKYVEPEGDNIITDKRRIPLIFERPIPEDPNQPITLTFEVEQPMEGSALSNIGMAREVGHTFLTLKYSKTNPATGKLERFQTSFGFYPAQTDGVRMMKTSYTGGTVEGLIMDDYDHSVSVGSTVEITPQQFNAIVRYTGQYEKGGYSLFGRNCTNFALDAIRHAKVEIPELEGLNQVEFTGLTLPGIAMGAAGLVAGNLLIHEMAKGITNRNAQTKAVTYSRIGQNKASAEDVERTTAYELNRRVRGYTPGETAEHMRAHGAIELHSKRYDGTERTRKRAYDTILNSLHSVKQNAIRAKKEDEREAELRKDHNPRFLLEMMKDEIPAMKSALTGVYGKRNAAMTPIINNLEHFLQASRQALEVYANDILGKNLLVSEALPRLQEACKQTNEFITDLNRLYHENFKSDPRLNIPFQHMTSLAERLRNEWYNQYLTTLTKTSYTFDKNPLAQKKISIEEKKRLWKDERTMYDQSRAVSTALYLADHTAAYFPIYPTDDMFNVVNSTLTSKQLMGLTMAFEEPLDALEKISQANDDDLPKDIKKEYEAMSTTLTQMSDAVEMLHDGHRFTEAELRRVFVDAPVTVKKLGLPNESILQPYRAMAVDGILGNNFFPELDEFIRRDITAHRQQLEMPGMDELARLKHQLSGVTPAKATPEQRELLRRREQLAVEEMNVRNFQYEYVEDLQRRIVEQFNQKLAQLPEETKRQLTHLGELAAEGVQKVQQTDNPDLTLTPAQRASFAEEGVKDALMNGYLFTRIMKATKSLIPNPSALHEPNARPQRDPNDLLLKSFIGASPCWEPSDALTRWTPTGILTQPAPAPVQAPVQAPQRAPARRNTLPNAQPKQEKPGKQADKPTRNSVL